jgi:uncharacterized repeat protein (TIGR03833 family)
MKVAIVLKQIKSTGKLTEGIVKDILTTPLLIPTASKCALLP